MLNIYILLYLLVSVSCMLVMALVLFLQFREVRRPKNSFTRLRWRLFFLPALIVASLALGLPRLFDSLYLPPSGGQVLRVISGMVMLSSFTLLIFSIYTYKEKK